MPRQRRERPAARPRPPAEPPQLGFELRRLQGLAPRPGLARPLEPLDELEQLGCETPAHQGVRGRHPRLPELGAIRRGPPRPVAREEAGLRDLRLRQGSEGARARGRRGRRAPRGRRRRGGQRPHAGRRHRGVPDVGSQRRRACFPRRVHGDHADAGPGLHQGALRQAVCPCRPKQGRRYRHGRVHLLVVRVSEPSRERLPGHAR
mmetsp:Transcript_65978/g.202053  ORF Transcript_65978/g.202053 Transcript_65978/m.202053 type:complete len:205 (-) Transcript_65978:53-667(-)